MKNINLLKKILSSELNKSLKSLHSLEKSFHFYYNENFGDTSFILAGILEQLLNESYNWKATSDRWVDDSLIADFNLYEDKLSITGVMIWGTGHTTEQWVEPFYFDTSLNKNKAYTKVNMKDYNLYFADFDNPAIPYGYFTNKREYWGQDTRNWAYQFRSKLFYSASQKKEENQNKTELSSVLIELP